MKKTKSPVFFVALLVPSVIVVSGIDFLDQLAPCFKKSDTIDAEIIGPVHGADQPGPWIEVRIETPDGKEYRYMRPAYFDGKSENKCVFERR